MRICVCRSIHFGPGHQPFQGNHEVAFRRFARIAHTVAVRVKIGRAAQQAVELSENQGVLSRRVAVKNVDVITPELRSLLRDLESQKF